MKIVKAGVQCFSNFIECSYKTDNAGNLGKLLKNALNTNGIEMISIFGVGVNISDTG